MPALHSLDLIDRRLRPICEAYLGADQVPGASIAVVVADEAYHHAYGVKAVHSPAPVTAQTGFNIGSCSKAFVSAAIASLVAEGRLKWDDPVCKYVPELQLYDPWITQNASFRDLSANRLGLARAGLTEFGLDPSLPATYACEKLKYTAPVHPFRDQFGYVNAGHTANAIAVGRITGKGFLTSLRSRILEPLGMRTTSGGAAAREDLADQAAWHCIGDHGLVQIDALYTDQYLGAGGMVVSGEDSIQWLRLHLNGGTVDGRQVLARDALLETHTPQTVARQGPDTVTLFYPRAHVVAYALGWAVCDFEGHPLVCHSGGDLGATAMTLLLPRAGIGVAVYGNSRSRSVVATAYAIAASLLRLPARDWLADFAERAPGSNSDKTSGTEPHASIDVALYVGTYSHPADGDLVIEQRGDGLVGRLKMGYRFEFELVPVDQHRFHLRFAHPEWQAAARRERPALLFRVPGGGAQTAELLAGPMGRVFERERRCS